MSLARDVRYAIRTLRRNPGYTLAALLTLMLGLGANAAVFSVVHGILLAPLPYPDAGRLVSVREESLARRPMDAAWPNFRDWRERSRSFTEMASHARGGPATVVSDGVPLRVNVSTISEGFFRTLGVAPRLGRAPSAEEHVAGGAPVVVVSDAFWRNQLGSDPDPFSRRIEVLSWTAQIIGVMPPAFDYPEGTAIWMPIELEEQPDSRTSHSYTVVARMRDGMDPGAAEAELDAITATFIDDIPAVDRVEGFEAYFPGGAIVQPLRDALVGNVRRPLWMLLGASVFVLLVACTNLASATLARGTGREREYAVRRSLGAERATVLRQLFIESLVLALAGGALAILLAALALRLLPAVAPAGIPRLADVRLDAPVLLVALAVTVVTAALFGLLPALRVTEGRFAGILRTGGRGGESRGSQRIWKALVGAEVALALTLLVGSGLLIRSFFTVLAVDPGFRTGGVLTATVNPSPGRYGEDAARRTYYERLLTEIERVPGLESAGLVTAAPMTGLANGRVDVREGPSSYANGYYQLVAGDYFQALDIPLIAGRLFDERDREGTQHVVIVNRTFAELAWPGEDAIGKQMTGGGMDNFWNQERYATVIGIVEDIRQRDLTRAPDPTYYFPLAQRPFRARSMTAVLRPASGNASALAPAVRDAVRAVDAEVPVALSTIESEMASALTPRRFTVLVLGLFAAIALALACVGIWGVVSYAVARRTREIGIRMALGADPGSVRRLVQRDYLQAAAIGGIAGIALSIGLARVIRSMLYETTAADPVTFLSVLAVLGAATWLASFIPSLRGTRVSPMETMRAE